MNSTASAETTIQTIYAFIQKNRWLAPPLEVTFLAAGEYNANYTVHSPSGTYVFRINHGTQLGLENQIEYEYAVLTALADSGVTPRPHAVAPAPNGFKGGVLLMDFVPGRPLRYETDLATAATIFARVHAQPCSEHLLSQPQPVLDIVAECEELLDRYPDHPLPQAQKTIQNYLETIRRMGEDSRDFFTAQEQCIVNTEVNANNFCINPGGRSFLVDWEKAVVSSRYQDLGHFLVQTTTRWKTATVLTEAQKRDFLTSYRDASGLDCDLEELHYGTRLLEKTILLRALSWCAMAYYEYTQTDRPIQNRDTFAKISEYLDNVEWILG